MRFIRIVNFIFRFLFAMAILVTVLGVAVAGLAYWHFSRDLPNYQQLADYQPPIVTRVHAGDGRLLAEYATEKRVFVPVREIPPLVIHAFLAAEDKNFYSHFGVDPLAMARAGITDLMRASHKRRPQGASTITQQVAKNFLVGSELSYQRKIKEALVAMRLEKALSKDRILELYLNEIYLGGGAYGVAAAALQYFDKSLDELTIEEAAFLAALPKAPNNYNPHRYPEAAKARRDWVIDRMVEAGYATPEQAKAAQGVQITVRRRDDAQSVTANYFAEEVRRELLARYGEKGLYQSGLSVRTSLDPALQQLADKVLRKGLVAYDRRHGYRGPVTHLETGTDWRKRLQAVAPPAGFADSGWKLAFVESTGSAGASIGMVDGETGLIPFDELRWARRVLDDDKLGPVPRNVGDVLKPGDVVLVEPFTPPPAVAPAPKKGKNAAPPKEPETRGPLFTLRQIPAVSGAMVVIDPHTGRVLALVGGFSYEMSQFDRATQAKRQIGSTMKPFVYLTAFDHGLTPSTVVEDAPLSIDQGPGLPPWRPNNYGHNFYGPMTLRRAVEQSRNLVTARVAQMIGLDAIADTVERFGIMDRMPREYSMVLGAGETTPLRLTTAFAMLDNGGKRITPTLIDRVQDRNGVTIYRADARTCEHCQEGDWRNQAPPEPPDTREQIIDPRSDYQIVSVLQGVVDRGTAHIVAAVGKPLAGKTGTTNDSNDTWFVGFSPDLVAGVFVGFDQPSSLGAHETGASVAAPIFRDFMAVALKDKPAIPFRIPPGIELVRVNAKTGQLAEPGDSPVIYEAFKPGTEPSGGETAAVNTGPISDDDDAASLGAAGGGEVASGAGGTAMGASVAAPTPAAAPPARGVPSTGTGGLY